MKRWYYTHAGQVFGPATTEQLRQLVQSGELVATDMIWPETGSRADAVEARTRLDFSTRTGPTPTWVEEIRVPPPPVKSKPGVPDWLGDVEQSAPTRPHPPPPPPPVTPVAAGLPQESLPVINVELVAPPAPSVPSVPSGVPQGIQVGGFSSVGRVRERNEDRFFAHHWTCNDGASTREGALLIVADGMGGYQGGDRASTVTVRVIARQLLLLPLQRLIGTDPEPTLEALLNAVVRSLVEANHIVFEEAKAEARFAGMGATVAVVLIWQDRTLISHVGDCRVYLQRGETLTQLTRDQTLVDRMIELGQLTPEEAATHPSRNEVTQAIGKRTTIEPSRHEEPLKRGDRVVVACDGLDAHVPVETLRQLLAGSTKCPALLAADCVGMADEAGGTDNCTVAIAHYC